MRKLRCLQAPGICVEEVLDEFNARCEEFGVREEDVVSVSALPATGNVRVKGDGGAENARVEVVIVYWSDN